MASSDGDITRLLRRWREGSTEAENELFRLVMPDLRKFAHYFMKGERSGHTLQSTELVDEIYFRLVAAKDRDWQSRGHFYAFAARAMRRHLIDYARKRGGKHFVPLEELEGVLRASGPKVETALMVDNLLEQLERAQSGLCTIVELKFFLGLSDEEAADALGLKLRSFQRKWHNARRWMFERLENGDGKQLSS